jgi:Ca2+-binding EF-hand superfamily protein
MYVKILPCIEGIDLNHSLNYKNHLKNKTMRNYLSKNLFFGIVATTLSATSSFGQTEKEGNKPPKEKPTFSELLTKMDKNKDGKLAESEVEGPLKRDFATIDANKDGFITEKEFAKAPNREKPPKEKK